MAKPVGEFNELDCLRALVAKYYGVNSDGSLGSGNLPVNANLEIDESTLATSAKQDTQITAEQAILAALNARLGKGAANLATSQVTSTGTAATLVTARATRRSVLITNLEDPATESAKIAYVGPATVTTGNGYPILPGQSVPFTWVGLIQVIDDTTNHAVLAITDEYD